MWKFVFIFLLTGLIVQFLFRERKDEKGEVAEVTKKNRTKETVPPRKRKARGVIVEPTEYTSGYSIAYYDLQEPDNDFEYLSSQGYQGGGPSWEGIIYGVLKIKDPQLLSRIEFDAEGDGLLINGDTKSDMEKVSFWIDEVKWNRKLMQRAIMMANIDNRME